MRETLPRIAWHGVIGHRVRRFAGLLLCVLPIATAAAKTGLADE